MVKLNLDHVGSRLFVVYDRTKNVNKNLYKLMALTFFIKGVSFNAQNHLPFFEPSYNELHTSLIENADSSEVVMDDNYVLSIKMSFKVLTKNIYK